MYFRALPGLLRDLQTALIKGKDGGREGVVSVADFVECVRDSEAPLSTTEAVVVAELLSRGRDGGREGGREGGKVVEIVHLDRIKRGDVIQARR